MQLRRLLLAALVLPLAVSAAQAADVTAQACPPTATALEAIEAKAGIRTAQDRGMLWRLEKDGHTSWLYGTIHVAKRSWVYPGPVIQHALNAADRVALELNMLDPDIAAQLGEAMKVNPGAPALPPALAMRLQAQMQAACLGNALAAIRPEMQAMTLLSLAGRAQGLDPSYGIDIVLAGFGTAQGKPVLSLEKPAQQMALLLSNDPAEVVKVVDEALQSLEQNESQKTLRRLAQAWAEGRVDELEHYADWCACMDTPAQREAYDHLVVERNPGLARRVAQLHEQGHSVFAAVGALHMVGAQGLPALLAAAGFKVERVPFAPLRATSAGPHPPEEATPSQPSSSTQ